MKSSYDGPSEYSTLTPLGTRRGGTRSVRDISPESNRSTPSRSLGWSFPDVAVGSGTRASTLASASTRLDASAASFCPAAVPSKIPSPARADKLKAATFPSQADSRPLCRYHFLGEGSCTLGDRCRFSHSFPPGVSTIEEARKRIPCQYYLRGECKYGDACLLGHDIEGSGKPAGAARPHPQPDQRELVSCAIGKMPRGEYQAKEDQDDRTCGICFEDVSATEVGCFGLLSCCDHRFCLSCLRQWRRTKGVSSPEVVRSCPTCRKKSDYVIPCRRFVTGAEKERVVEEFRTRKASQPCDKFDGTMGSCPFGRECFYAHLRDGVDVKALDRDPAEMAKERARRHRRRHDGLRHLIPPWIFDDFAGTANADDIEAIASFLALLSFYGYGISDDSDDEDDASEAGI